MENSLVDFDQIWLVDFEFHAPDGDRPQPICLVANELRSNRTVRLWRDRLLRSNHPPYSTSKNSLVVAFYASAEMGCHISLRWPLPPRILDVYTEFRWLTNGLRTPSGNSLLGALAYFGIAGIESTEKAEMRNLAIRGGPWTRRRNRHY